MTDAEKNLEMGARMLDDQCHQCGIHWSLGDLMYVVSKLTDEEWLYVTGAQSIACRAEGGPDEENS